TARPIACAYSPPKFRRRILFQPFLFGAQALAREERRIEQATEIKRSAIAEQRDDGMPGTYFAGDAYRCGDVDARRAAHEEPFVAEQMVDHGHAIPVGDLHCIVDRCALEIGGYAARADAFGYRAAFRFELAGPHVAVERA